MRGNGAESQADRPFLAKNKCCLIPELLRGQDDARTTSMMSFQRRLIARMDDVANVKKETMKASKR